MSVIDSPLAGEISALRSHIKTRQGDIAKASAEVEKLEGAWKADGRTPTDALAEAHREQFSAIVAARTAQGEAREEIVQAQSDLLALTRPFTEPASLANAEGAGSPGEVFTASDSYTSAGDWTENKGAQARAEVSTTKQASIMLASADPSALLDPQSINREIMLPERANRLLQLLRVTPTTAPTVEYVVETLRRELAKEIAHATPGATGNTPVTPAVGVETPESEFLWAKATAAIKRIGHHYTVPRSMMADIPRLESYINERGPKGIINRVEQQVYSGDGTGENIRGILNTTGVLAGVRTSGDTVQDAIHRAMVVVALANESEMPNGIVLHPNDYQAFVLQKDNNGNYMNNSGAAFTANPTIWGKTAISSTLATQGTALIGDFSQAELFVRSGVRVEAGFMERQLISDVITLNFEARMGFGVLRPSSFIALNLAVVV